jgi:hypothetical protein
VDPRLDRERDGTVVSCWHAGSDVESDALWRIYGPKEEMIAVSTSVDGLIQAVAGAEEQVNIGTVAYIDYETYVLEPGQVFRASMSRRKAFVHEKEVRALIVADDVLPLPIPDRLPQPAEGRTVGVDLHALIQEVIVSPYGEEWFLQAITSLVREHGLEAEVRFSNLRA